MIAAIARLTNTYTTFDRIVNCNVNSITANPFQTTFSCGQHRSNQGNVIACPLRLHYMQLYRSSKDVHTGKQI